MAYESSDWLEIARSDFDDAVFNLENEHLAPGVFFLQQSVEKTLKSVIIDEGDEPPFTHNLLELAYKADIPEDLTARFEELNNLYTGVRYPGEEIDEIEDLDELIGVVEEVLEWTEKQLEK
jgi:HEPN domain-containing protein